MPTDTGAVAAQLETAADLVAASPGLNVLDAFRQAADAAHLRGPDRDAVVGDAYYQLLGYLPPHVVLLAPWSDSETSERVAAKLQQLARTLRKGGPAKIESLPPLADPADLTLTTVRAEAASRAKAPRTFTEEGRLRLQRSTALRWLQVQQRKAHPDAAKVTELQLRIAAIDRELAEQATAAATADGELVEERELVAAGNGYQRTSSSLSGL
jgi:hypothetical protein